MNFNERKSKFIETIFFIDGLLKAVINKIVSVLDKMSTTEAAIVPTDQVVNGDDQTNAKQLLCLKVNVSLYLFCQKF